MFIELVKVCDSIQHDINKETLNMFGVPRDVIAWVMGLCRKYSVVLKVGMIKRLIPHGCNVKQGDSLAPTLFVMVTQIAA